MKLRLIPILLLLVGAAGLVLYATTPVVLTKAHYVRAVGPNDLVQSFKVNFDGSGEVTTVGTYIGNPYEHTQLIPVDGWDYYSQIDPEPFPTITMYLSFIGLGIAVLGMFFSIFGYSNGLRIAGALLAIIGGGLGLAGSFMLYNWNLEFQEGCEDYIQINAAFLYSDEYEITYSTFGPGWLAPVISSGLIALGSVFLLLTKPKK